MTIGYPVVRLRVNPASRLPLDATHWFTMVSCLLLPELCEWMKWIKYTKGAPTVFNALVEYFFSVNHWSFSLNP